MKIQEAKQIAITDILEKLGYNPKKQKEVKFGIYHL